MKSETQAWLILIFLSLVWGSSFILIKKSMFPLDGITVFSPYQVGAVRMTIASIVLLPIALKNISHLKKGKNLFLFFMVGLCGNFMPSFLFPLAETKIQSSLAGLLNMGTSVFIIIISYLFFKVKITKIQLFGFLLGASGLFLILHEQIDSKKNDFTYSLLVLLATLFYATSLSLIKYKLSAFKPLTITSLAFFLMLIPSLISIFITDTVSVFQKNEHVWDGLQYLIILSIVGTALAVMLFNQLVVISTPLFASSVTYIMPVIAIFLGVLDGEKFNPYNIFWIVLIFIGVFFMSRKIKNKS